MPETEPEPKIDLDFDSMISPDGGAAPDTSFTEPESPIDDSRDSDPAAPEPAMPEPDMSEPDMSMPETKKPDTGMDDLADFPLDLPSVEELSLEPTAPVKKTSVAPAAEAAPLSGDPVPREQKPAAKAAPAAALVLNDNQLRFVQMRIEHFGPGLRDAVKSIVIDEKLERQEINALLKFILLKKPVKKIKEFVEEKTGLVITGPLLDEAYKQKVKARGIRPRRAKYRPGRKSGWEVFMEQYFPALRPVILMVAALLLLYLIAWPPIRSGFLINDGVKLIAQKESASIGQAEDNFNQALKTRPRFFGAYLTYADAYISAGLFQKAYEKLSEFRSLAGQTFDYLMTMGRYNETQEIWDEARSFYDKAHRMRPENFRAIDAIGHIDFVRDKIDDSQMLYEAYVRKNPRNVQAQ